MKLTTFQSDKGDCLLVTAKDGRRILVDGGMRASFTKHVAPTLNQLQKEGKHLDLVYVSHIDRDHISGVLQLMDDLVEWRVFDFHSKKGNSKVKKPKSLRPPEVNAIWHNAFNEQLGKNAGEIRDMLAATATILSGGETKLAQSLASAYGELATSTDEAIKLSRRVGAKQLNIPLNPQFKGKLAMVRKAGKIKFGGMSASILGPFEIDLANLRKEWNKWLSDNSEKVKKISARAKVDEKNLTGNEVARIVVPAQFQANELANEIKIELQELGIREEVTAPNLASLMILLEENQAKVLLTGDGHSNDILKGLKQFKKLKNGAGLHVDVLKIQHHGSENNIESEFCKKITADHYIFCGNGAHQNPDLRVVELIINSRIGDDSVRSKNTETGNPFKLWFNSSSTHEGKAKDRSHMQKVEKLVADLAKKSKGKLKSNFLKASKFELDLG